MPGAAQTLTNVKISATLTSQWHVMLYWAVHRDVSCQDAGDDDHIGPAYVS